jgi:citrate lyase subunit gamma (acyl carrier protein)
MKIKKTGIAGTLESSDAMVTIGINKKRGIDLTIKSTVQQQFGDDIKEVAMEVLSALCITQCKITIEDKGALDCTVIARVRTAVYRACDIAAYNWEV